MAGQNRRGLHFGSQSKTHFLFALLGNGGRPLFNKPTFLCKLDNEVSVCVFFFFFSLLLFFNVIGKVACGNEQLCGIDASISHCHCFCIAHFHALCFSSVLRLDPRRYFPPSLHWNDSFYEHLYGVIFLYKIVVLFYGIK